MRKLVALASTVALVAAPAGAQTTPPRLHPVIEEIDKDAIACGVSRESLIAALRSAMRYNRIEEEPEDFKAPTVYVWVAAVHIGSICMGHVALDIYQHGTATIPGTSQRAVMHEQFCKQAVTLSGPGNLRLMDQAVRETFDACLSQITDNAFS